MALTYDEKKALADKLANIEKDVADAKATLDREFSDTEETPAEKPKSEEDEKDTE